MTRIAFLGLGAMGRRIATRLVDGGHEVTVWNRSAAPVEPFRATAAHVATTPREAVQDADVVWSMVYDDDASRDVWLDPTTGALAALRPGTLAIESSTLSPRWVTSLASEVEARDVHLVDAPVTGSRLQADGGQLIFLAGGRDEDVDALRPLFAIAGQAVHHVGAVGSGAILKLAVNAFFATQVVGMAEALDLLRRSGLDARASGALAALPVTSAAAAGAARAMLAADYAPQAPVDLIAKDLSYALAHADEHGGTPSVTRTVAARFAAASAAGYGAENLVAVSKLY